VPYTRSLRHDCSPWSIPGRAAVARPCSSRRNCRRRCHRLRKSLSVDVDRDIQPGWVIEKNRSAQGIGIRIDIASEPDRVASTYLPTAGHNPGSSSDAVPPAHRRLVRGSAGCRQMYRDRPVFTGRPLARGKSQLARRGDSRRQLSRYAVASCQRYCSTKEPGDFATTRR